jgi:adenosylcobinamide amidohydrolase
VILDPDVSSHGTGGGLLDGDAPVLVWRFDQPVRAVSSAVLGGGLGDRCWIANATVGFQYDEPDPAGHAARIATELGLDPATGVGLLTAVAVTTFTRAGDHGAEAVATTGLGAVTWAAAPDGEFHEWRPGTVNVVAWVPEPLADAALVNLVATVAEAKAQALGEAGVPATGTPTDAVAVCCPRGPAPDDDDHRYGGPRSRWGSRVARAVHRAVLEGIDVDRARAR